MKFVTGRLSTWIARVLGLVGQPLDGDQRAALPFDQLARRRRIVRRPDVDPAEVGMVDLQVAADRVAGEPVPRLMLQPPAELDRLAERDELGDLERALVVAEQRCEADDRPAGVGDQDDVVASAIAQPCDPLDEPRPDRGRLRLIVEDDRQVAEPFHDEHVGRGDLDAFADRRDRDRVERGVDRRARRGPQRSR